MPLISQKRSLVKPEAVLRQIRLMESLESKTSEEATRILSNWLLEGNQALIKGNNHTMI
jgi:hypothetical protein